MKTVSIEVPYDDLMNALERRSNFTMCLSIRPRGDRYGETLEIVEVSDAGTIKIRFTYKQCGSTIRVVDIPLDALINYDRLIANIATLRDKGANNHGSCTPVTEFNPS